MQLEDKTYSVCHDSFLLSSQQVFTPSPRNYGDVISAAMSHSDVTTAWTLYDELIEKGLSPHQDTWNALYKWSSNMKGMDAHTEYEHQERLLGILLYMRNNEIYPQHNLTTSIKTWFERYNRVIWMLTVRW